MLLNLDLCTVPQQKGWSPSRFISSELFFGEPFSFRWTSHFFRSEYSESCGNLQAPMLMPGNRFYSVHFSSIFEAAAIPSSTFSLCSSDSNSKWILGNLWGLETFKRPCGRPPPDESLKSARSLLHSRFASYEKAVFTSCQFVIKFKLTFFFLENFNKYSNISNTSFHHFVYLHLRPITSKIWITLKSQLRSE